MKYEHTVRSESILALADYFNKLKQEDKHQLFDISIHMGNLYCQTRISKNDGDFFTHYENFVIDRDGMFCSIFVMPIDEEV